ncbi:Crp/Fnr family transcriptional regulator [Oleisolibacter albus]|uniref:Crp/Fnr family transcriptional regulator n=1 Tax=Oleisolibacter albus TaxID=2171757 RepID=UPI000DF3B355|nr:Crp/Fnr family transcriptional regulator [Oleisolibacter albus]
MKTPQIEAAWKGTAACRNCAIRHLALFSELEETDFQHIHLPIEELHFDAGAQLYGLDEPARAVFTIRSGMVKLVHVQADGTQRIVRLFRRGAVAGLEALVRPSYEHIAICVQPTEVCRIPREVIGQLQAETPRLHRRLMEKWYEALSVADDFLTDLSTGSARQRLARLLLHLTAEQPEQPVRLFTREDLGAMLAVTLETASRTISEFKRAGLIREIAHNLVLCDRDGLMAAARTD